VKEEVGKRLVIPVSQAMCATSHVSAGLKGFPGLERGGNFAQGCSGHLTAEDLVEFSGFVKIMRVYSTQPHSCKCWSEGAGDPGCSLSLLDSSLWEAAL